MTEILKVQVSGRMKELIEKRAIERGITSCTWGPSPEYIRQLIKADLDHVGRLNEFKMKDIPTDAIQVSLRHKDGTPIDRDDLDRRAAQLGLLGAPDYVRLLIMLDLMMAGHGVRDIVCPKCDGQRYWPKLENILEDTERKPCGRCKGTGKYRNENPLVNLKNRIRNE